MNILLLKSNLTAPGVELENLKGKVRDQASGRVTKEGALKHSGQTWLCRGSWCCPACLRISQTRCHCSRCPRGSNSSPRILTLNCERTFKMTRMRDDYDVCKTLMLINPFFFLPGGACLCIHYHRGKMRSPKTGAKTECCVSILWRSRLVMLMHFWKTKRWWIIGGDLCSLKFFCYFWSPAKNLRLSDSHNPHVRLSSP